MLKQWRIVNPRNFRIVRRGRRDGFTLIELLVVIGIVFSIAAILFPVLSVARKRALGAEDTSNLRQIGMAIRMYQQDHGGFPWWPGWLIPYAKNRQIFISPFDPARGGNLWAPHGYYPPMRNSYHFDALESIVEAISPIGINEYPDCAAIYERHPNDYPFAYDPTVIYTRPILPRRSLGCCIAPSYVLRGDGRVSVWRWPYGSDLSTAHFIEYATGEWPQIRTPKR